MILLAVIQAVFNHRASCALKREAIVDEIGAGSSIIGAAGAIREAGRVERSKIGSQAAPLYGCGVLRGAKVANGVAVGAGVAVAAGFGVATCA